MKRNGFTLVELLAVIILLAIILLLVVPSVLKSYDNSKKNLYNIMVNNICDSASNYLDEYHAGTITPEESLCVVSSTTTTCNIDFNELVRKKYLGQNIKNPLTQKDITLSNVDIVAVSEGQKDSNGNDIYIFKVTIDEDEIICNK